MRLGKSHLSSVSSRLSSLPAQHWPPNGKLESPHLCLRKKRCLPKHLSRRNITTYSGVFYLFAKTGLIRTYLSWIIKDCQLGKQNQVWYGAPIWNIWEDKLIYLHISYNRKANPLMEQSVGEFNGWSCPWKLGRNAWPKTWFQIWQLSRPKPFGL